MIVFGNADASVHKISLQAEVNGTLEVCFDVNGYKKYQSIEINESKISLKSYKTCNKLFTSRLKISKIYTDVNVHVVIERTKNTLRVQVNDECFTFEAEESKGALGFRVDGNSSARITWCQFVMHEFS